ncbi:Ubiquitin carboxyl-terminal hydrolase 20 [Modicella reniformis]|uniref:Ubiquitin carboxyl-terminal hydrolase 20 n=1 Tax=Modicella reniformis TaxID=1440133 RepID=A0A9P6MJI0_9FUNG|nr:Ubiquitin carboxyl-terminal hydrolase 20 [Modicella reniformis]
MNAALQALSHTPGLINYFQTCGVFVPEGRGIEYARQKNLVLANSFLCFILSMWNGKSVIHSPGYLVSDVKKCNEAFQGTSQQDSQEFLRCIMDKLHEELTYPRRALDPATISDTPEFNEKSVSSPRRSNMTVQPPQTNSNGTSKESSKSGQTKKGITATSISSLSYPSSRSSTSSRSVRSSENSSMSENVEITPARATAPSIISDLFEGTLESRVRCLICRKQYIKEDKFFDLSIPVDKKTKIIDDTDDKGTGKDKDGGLMGSIFETIGGWFNVGNRNIKLQDCLAAFCATEELTGEDRYRCTQCDALNDCRKTFRITQLPETLCIHLKRFRYDTYSSKINTYVQFPLEDLDMTPFFKSTDPNELKNVKYDLYAMVRHRGVAGGGHYIGYAKHSGDGLWYEFDDTYVTRKSPADIAKLEAYILFYRKKTPHREEERARIAKFITKPNMEIFDKGLMVYISRLWFCRFNFLSNPGPISNRDFLCPHDKINVVTTRNVMEMVMPIPEAAWKALVNMYGTDGSPVVTISHLESKDKMACDICHYEEIVLEERRAREDEDVSRLDSSMVDEGQFWYLIGADWLKEWHAFKGGDRPPGPIRNSQFLKDNGQPRAGMKRGMDYRGINQNVWRYLYSIYGGGPEFVRASLDLYAPDPKTLMANSPSRSSTSSARNSLQSHQPHLYHLPPQHQQHHQHHHQHQQQQQQYQNGHPKKYGNKHGPSAVNPPTKMGLT